MHLSSTCAGGRPAARAAVRPGTTRSGTRALIAATLTALALLTGCTPGAPGPGQAPRTASPSSPEAPSSRQTTLEPEQDLLVRGHHFAAQCTGHGPSVLLVSGYGSPKDYWADVPTRLGVAARTCTYDRLGTEHSDPPPATQTFEDIATDLDGVISALRLPRPVVLVAHSLGGPIALTWAARHPADTQGLVLLDPTPPGFQAAMSSLLPPPDPRDPELTAMIADERRFNDPATNQERLDPASWTVYDAMHRLDVPLWVLAADQAPRMPYAVDAEKVFAAWQAGQRRLARISEDSHLVTATGSDHLIWLWRLDLVLATVKDALTT